MNISKVGIFICVCITFAFSDEDKVTGKDFVKGLRIGETTFNEIDSYISTCNWERSSKMAYSMFEKTIQCKNGGTRTYKEPIRKITVWDKKEGNWEVILSFWKVYKEYKLFSYCLHKIIRTSGGEIKSKEIVKCEEFENKQNCIELDTVKNPYRIWEENESVKSFHCQDAEEIKKMMPGLVFGKRNMLLDSYIFSKKWKPIHAEIIYPVYDTIICSSDKKFVISDKVNISIYKGGKDCQNNLVCESRYFDGAFRLYRYKVMKNPLKKENIYAHFRDMPFPDSMAVCNKIDKTKYKYRRLECIVK